MEMNVKKIIFLQENAYGKSGIARVVNMIANQLYEKNYKVEMISIIHEDNNPCFYLEKGIEIKNLEFKTFNLKMNSLQASYRLNKLLPKKDRALFVVCEIGNVLLADLGLHGFLNYKKIVWLHTNSNHGSEYGFAGIGRRIAFDKFDKIITLTKEDEQYLVDKFNKKEKLIQIYNPFDPKFIEKKYNIKSNRIISCGNLYTVKGFEAAIKVANEIFKNDISKNWQWDIYGDGPEKNNLMELIKTYHLEDKVILKGYESNIYSVYHNYAINVFTSIHEGCPMAMVEAKSAKLPIVSFDFPCGPKDMIIDGVNGYIIQNRNIEEMAKKILYLIENDEIREKFSNNATSCLEEMTMEYVMHKWSNLIDSEGN